MGIGRKALCLASALSILHAEMRFIVAPTNRCYQQASCCKLEDHSATCAHVDEHTQGRIRTCANNIHHDLNVAPYDGTDHTDVGGSSYCYMNYCNMLLPQSKAVCSHVVTSVCRPTCASPVDCVRGENSSVDVTNRGARDRRLQISASSIRRTFVLNGVWLLSTWT